MKPGKLKDQYQGQGTRKFFSFPDINKVISNIGL